MGAPRLVAAMANDRILPFLDVFAVKEGEEPRKALALTATITLAGVLVGECARLVSPTMQSTAMSSIGKSCRNGSEYIPPKQWPLLIAKLITKFCLDQRCCVLAKGAALIRYGEAAHDK